MAERNMKMMDTKCQWHEDCFANVSGRCVCLQDTDFKGGCPFYKSGKVVNLKEIRKACGAYKAMYA